MPRKQMPARKARLALLNLRLQSARRDAITARRDHHARESALVLRKATPDWVDLTARLKQLELEAEMDAMEASIDARTPKIPTLNFDLMPGFSPPPKPEPEIHEPDIHEDVLFQDALLKVQEPRPANQNTPPPPGGKNWKYNRENDDRRPEDDWRNWE